MGGRGRDLASDLFMAQRLAIVHEPAESSRCLVRCAAPPPRPLTPPHTHTHNSVSPVEQAPIVSRVGCVLTCVSICVFVVTGALNSSVLAQPDRQVLEGPLTRSLAHSLTRLLGIE